MQCIKIPQQESIAAKKLFSCLFPSLSIKNTEKRSINQQTSTHFFYFSRNHAHENQIISRHLYCILPTNQQQAVHKQSKKPPNKQNQYLFDKTKVRENRVKSSTWRIARKYRNLTAFGARQIHSPTWDSHTRSAKPR